MKSGCQVKAFSPATPIQSQFNPVQTSLCFFFFTDTVDHHFPIILYENLIFPISLLQD